jgi:hypothetical protein
MVFIWGDATVTSNVVSKYRFLAVALCLILFAASAGLPLAEAQPQNQLFVVIYRPGPAWQAGVPMAKQGLGPHAAYYQQMFDRGQVHAGGGFTDGDGGMAILIAANLDEARALLAADPAITSGIFVGELEQWRPRFRSDKALPASQ